MVYFTGDTHGVFNKIFWFIKKFELTSDDTIVILGDAGFNYFGNGNGDKAKKRRVNKLGVTILCIHGNHEMRPESLEYYHEETWQGGIVYVENKLENIKFAKDGEIYDLDGLKAIAIGGAYSVDKYYRLAQGYGWFEDEQPSDEIKARVENKLDSLNWNVDIVLSHTCPYRYIPREAFIQGINQSTVDNSTEDWLDSIEERLNYKHWFCGHWHIDKNIDKMHFLMDSFRAIPQQIS